MSCVKPASISSAARQWHSSAVKRTLGAGLGLGAVNALLALLAVHLFRASELGGLGWFGGSSGMPRRYADYLPGPSHHTSALLVLVVVIAFLAANIVMLDVGYRLGRRAHD
jgi:heme/copper-type cytochrome/quinol oxidase subunit 1